MVVVVVVVVGWAVCGLGLRWWLVGLVVVDLDLLFVVEL
jgi:hypothetical protein